MPTPTNPRHAELHRLLAAWQDAQRIYLRQPTKDNGALAQEAHAAYLAEQTRIISKS
jgi:hypothetical protein